MNPKNTSSKVAKLAAQTLSNDNASAIAQSLAGSALAQVNKGYQPSAEMQAKAGKVLQSDKYSDVTQALAASIVSQSPKP